MRRSFCINSKHFFLEYDTWGSIHNDFLSKITGSWLSQQTNICLKLTIWEYNISVLTRFRSMFHFYTPRKYQKTIDFLMFLGDIEVKHWPEMGHKLANKHQVKAIWRILVTCWFWIHSVPLSSNFMTDFEHSIVYEM